MSDVRPQDVPEICAEMLAYYARPTTHEAWRTMADRQMFTWPGDGEVFLAQEIRRLRRESYWVAPDMVALAQAAGATMPKFTVHEHDLPSLFGFMYFAEPVGMVETSTPDGRSVTAPVDACAWGPVSGTDGSALWLSVYVRARTVEEMCDDSPGMTLQEARRVRAELPSRIQYENETLIPFGHDWKTFVVANSILDTLGRTVRAIWSLMQQPLAECSDMEPDRAARKRLRRAGHEPALVRVVELRRPKSSGEHGDSGREFHHQWIVRGHWRQQWHPKREVHRPVWIAPHIKGPEGAPLIGGEKVYAWKR